ncbi:hypothetical protein J6590_100577, partial [Homalodisca vitripennis]
LSCLSLCKTYGYLKRGSLSKLDPPTCHLNLSNLMDVQEWHNTNHKCRDSGVQGQFDKSRLLRETAVGVDGVCSLPQRFLLASKRVCHQLPTLTGEAGSELATPSSGET